MIVAFGYDVQYDRPTNIVDARNLLSIRVKEGDYKGVAAQDI